MYQVERTDDEINDVLNDVSHRINEGGSRYPGMSYENGIEEALQWVLGKSDDHPYKDE